MLPLLLRLRPSFGFLHAALGKLPLLVGLRHYAIKPPPARGVKIFCSGCRTFLYAYKKGGTGKLVKCFVERIVQDATAGDMHCPKCRQQFARFARIKGVPAHKIIGAVIPVCLASMTLPFLIFAPPLEIGNRVFVKR
jgi:LSD1 subclass zinc finger protein